MDFPKLTKRSGLALRSAYRATAVLVPLLAAACTNVLTQNAPAALHTAETRAQFEMNCGQVQATVLSQKTVQGFRFEGSEHTIGVRGCGKQTVYVVYCRDPEDCNALSQTDRGITAIPNP
jgi:hypothetical protein